MATSAGSRPPKHGRPKLGIAIKRIGLQANIYDEWITKKKDLGFGEKGQKVFANTMLMAAAVLITGKNFEKMRTFFQFFGTGFFVFINILQNPKEVCCA